MRNNKGITLIALIVTIIVLLILAGVTFSAIVGDDGVIKKSVQAKENVEMAAIEEDVELIKKREYNSRRDFNLTQQKLLSIINQEYEDSYYVGNKIITADKKYQILVRNDNDLTIVVSKYKGGSIEPGKLYMDLIENRDYPGVEIYISIGGIQSYEDYVRDVLENKSYEEKIQILLDAVSCETEEELLANFEVTSMEELFAYIGVKDIEECIAMTGVIDEYDEDSNMIEVNVTGGSGIDEFIDTAYMPSTFDVLPGNGTYKYIASTGTQSVEDEITISWIDESVDDENIFTYDVTTGYITGIKDEYISYNMVQTFHAANPRYLLKGAPILHVPSEIDGTVIKGIDYEAFYEIYNISRIILPNTIEYLGDYSMAFCPYVRYVNIPDSVVEIGEYVFWQVPLKELYIPKSVTTIGEGLWYIWDLPKVINCEATSKPAGWDKEWIYSDHLDEITINWGVSRD